MLKRQRSVEEIEVGDLGEVEVHSQVYRWGGLYRRHRRVAGTRVVFCQRPLHILRDCGQP